MEAFDELVYMMANPNNHSIKSETLPDYTKQGFNFSPRYRSDQPHMFRSFGDVLKDVSAYYSKRTLPTPFVVSATFVAGNPRNDPMLNKSFLTVEKKVDGDQWKVIRTDNDYDTRYVLLVLYAESGADCKVRFIWKYKHQLLGMSEATIEWHVSNNVEPGIYRLGYFGNSRATFSK